MASSVSSGKPMGVLESNPAVKRHSIQWLGWGEG